MSRLFSEVSPPANIAKPIRCTADFSYFPSFFSRWLGRHLSACLALPASRASEFSKMYAVLIVEQMFGRKSPEQTRSAVRGSITVGINADNAYSNEPALGAIDWRG